MGSDGDNGQNSDPSSHSDYGGNYRGDVSSSSGSENSSTGARNPASSANLGFSGNVGGWGSRGPDGSIGGFGSGGFKDLAEVDWLGMISGINSFFSRAGAVGLLTGPAAAIPATLATYMFEYAWNNPHKGPPQGEYAIDQRTYGESAHPEPPKPTVKHQYLNQQGQPQDWGSFLAEMNNRFRSRGAQQPTDFTSLLES